MGLALPLWAAEGAWTWAPTAARAIPHGEALGETRPLPGFIHTGRLVATSPALLRVEPYMAAQRPGDMRLRFPAYPGTPRPEPANTKNARLCARP